MRTPVSGRRPRSGMTLGARPRAARPLPMGAVAVRRGRFGEFELRPVREFPADRTEQDHTEASRDGDKVTDQS